MTIDLAQIVTCTFCDVPFVGDRNFQMHDCPAHEPSIIACLWCGDDIQIDAKNSPAIVDGDPCCARCAYFKPWEQQKPFSDTNGGISSQMENQ